MCRAVAAGRRIAQHPAARVVAVVLAFAVAGLNLEHLPSLDLEPVLFGLLPWVVGKYVLCPLRWHGISASGKPRRWHLRVYAESELLGLLTPGTPAPTCSGPINCTSSGWSGRPPSLTSRSTG